MIVITDTDIIEAHLSKDQIVVSVTNYEIHLGEGIKVLSSATYKSFSEIPQEALRDILTAVLR